MLEILKAYQSWRRGDDDRALNETGLNPAIIGKAIDFVIAEIENKNVSLNKLEIALATARMENQEYELWIAAISEEHSAVPDWIRQSARSMLAKGAK